MGNMLRQSDPGGNISRPHDWETPGPQPENSTLLSPRSAGILGASIVIALAAVGLAYLALGATPAALAGALLTGGAALAAAIRLLSSIVG